MQDIILNYNVIVIDNDLVTLGMIQDMLVQNGISCDTCISVGELTDKMRDKDYDLLITDLKMPEVNGYEVQELLRTSDIGNSRTIPVVAATAAGFITEEELRSAGFTAMLSKPFSIAELRWILSPGWIAAAVVFITAAAILLKDCWIDDSADWRDILAGLIGFAWALLK